MGVAWKGISGLAGFVVRGGDLVLTSGQREGAEKPLLERWGTRGMGGRGHTSEPSYVHSRFLISHWQHAYLFRLNHFSC